MKDKILENMNNPHALEELYRNHPKEFELEFIDAFRENNNSELLRFWNERLNFQSILTVPISQTTSNRPAPLFIVILLSLIGGTIAKLPSFLTNIESTHFYERNIPFFVLPFITFYFIYQHRLKIKDAVIPIVVILGSAILINFFPSKSKSDTLILAFIHLPFFLWSIVGLSFVIPEYRNILNRIEYLKYNGELLIYTAILLIGGMILTGITTALFSVAGIEIITWYSQWVVIYGAIACPIAATLLCEIREKKNQRIAPLISKIFAPLFLITLTGYLIVVAFQHKNPFADRDFLISFNVMLIAVLCICIFIITERPEHRAIEFQDYMLIGLIVVSLFVDVIALSAILFRLTSYGFTPNRIVVLGANLIVFGNIIGLLFNYVKFLKGKSQLSKTFAWVGAYLPIYSLWSGFVTFIFPLLNSYK